MIELIGRVSRLLLKLEDYARMGVETIRVVQPATCAIFAFRRGSLIPIASKKEDLPAGPCSIDWTQIRELLDF